MDHRICATLTGMVAMANIGCAGGEHPPAQQAPSVATASNEPTPSATPNQSGAPELEVGAPAAAETNTPSAPCDADGMRRFEAARFSFRAPCDWQGGPRQGIDSQVGQFQAEGIRVEYDYGAYSSPLTEFADYPGYSRKKVSIDGREAYLVVVDEGEPKDTPFAAGVYIPKANGSAKLTLVGRASSREKRDRLLVIFRSIDLE